MAVNADLTLPDYIQTGHEVNDDAFGAYLESVGAAEDILYTGTPDMNITSLNELAVRGFDFALNEAREFEALDVAVPVIGNDFDQYLVDANSKIYEATNYVKNIFVNMDQVNEAWATISEKVKVKNTDETGAFDEDGYIAAMQSVEADMVPQMAAALNIDVSPPVDYPDVESIMTELESMVGDGIARVNVLMDQVIENVPNMKEAANIEETMEILSLASAFLVSFGVTTAGISGVLDWTINNPELTANDGIGRAMGVIIAGGVDMGTAIAFSNRGGWQHAGDLREFEGELGSQWQELVDSTESVEFATNSAAFGRRYGEVQIISEETDTTTWGQIVGEVVQTEAGNDYSISMAGSVENRQTNFEKHNEYIEIMQAQVDTFNANSPSGITYFVTYPPTDLDVGYDGEGDAVAVKEYFTEGNIEIRAIANPVMEAGVERPEPEAFPNETDLDFG